MTPSLDVSGVTFAYPDGHRALDGVDLRIGTGERVALLGPNGAGKTTLALHLNGILSPAGGTIEVGGLAVVPENYPEIRRRVGLVFQDPDDQLFMPTVGEDVAFGPANLGIRGTELADRTRNALEAVEAAELASRAPHHLSGGERRRASLATVLAMNPELLVLDEPTAGLDPFARREVGNVLDSLTVTQLVITHDLPFALQHCSRAVVMFRGRIAADGPTRALLSDEDLLRRHRLELPFGFDPAFLSRG